MRSFRINYLPAEFLPFVAEAVEALLEKTGGLETPRQLIRFIGEAVEDGTFGVFMQTGDDDKPIGLYVGAIRTADTGQIFMEVVLQYNLPQANPKLVLEELAIPWARSFGARMIRAYDFNPTIFAKRRLRRYGFEMRAVVYERRI